MWFKLRTISLAGYMLHPFPNIIIKTSAINTESVIAFFIKPTLYPFDCQKLCRFKPFTQFFNGGLMFVVNWMP
jgi:hypothetical protein